MASSTAVLAAAARLEYMRGAAVEWPEEDIMQLRSELAGVATDLDAHSSSACRRIDKDVVQLARDIEDTIESYVRARERAAGKPCGGILKFISTSSLRDDVNTFLRKIKEVKSHMREYNSQLGASELSSGKDHDIVVYHANGSSTAASSDPPLVAREEDVERLSSRLLKDDDNRGHLSVIAIYGNGGMGKTTLARSLLDHPKVKKKFDIRTWAHAGVDFKARGVLENILSAVCGWRWSRDKIQQMESMELMDGIYKALKGKRYLIVLDDITSGNDWGTVRFAFPDHNNGSRVVITTRSKNVADDAADYGHEMRPLTLDESWELMKPRFLGRKDLDTAKAQQIGQEILKHCQGVPLAVVTFSNLIKATELEDWKALLERFENQRTSENVLDFCYTLLPVHLKPCFLYLGHFPTDHVILIDKLFLLWMAEGFTSTKDKPYMSAFEIACNYFKELADRSMLMVQNRVESTSRGSNTCHIHDILRDLCIEKGKDEEFLRIVDYGRADHKVPNFVSHRLAIYLNMHEQADGVSIDIPEPKNVRALLFFEKHGAPTKPNSRWPAEVADLKEFRWARVLDFDGVDFRVKQLPRNIKKLFYLRFLSFRGCSLLEFPASFSSLSFLETLDLLVRESCPITISNVLWTFKRTRHLYLPVAFKIDGKDHKRMSLAGLMHLEILENFHAGLCDVNDLLDLDNIKVFTGVVDGNNDALENIAKCLRHWGIDRSPRSSLVVKNFDCYSEKRFSLVKNLLTNCNAPPVLEVEGHISRLPSCAEIGKNFTELVFDGSEFKQDPMQILGKLPLLRRLVLRCNAFIGNRIVCATSEFPELRFLKLAKLPSLEVFEVHSGAMPNLALFSIQQCKSLKMLDSQLIKIATLEEINIVLMPREFQQHVRSIAENLLVDAGVEVRLTFADTDLLH